MTPKPMFVRSNDARVIEDLLATTKVGDLITYESLDKALGRDCREFCRGALQGARRRLLRERGFVFDVLMDVGLKRLADGEVVQAASRDGLKIRKASRRASEKLATVDRNAISDKERLSLDIQQARFAVLEMVASPKGAKAIESQVTQSQTTLAMAQALEALKKA